MEAIMKTPELLKITQEINLIDGNFTPSEAADIINDVLKVKINFHKIQRLSNFEGNSKDPSEFDSNRIYELLQQKSIAKQFFSQARLNGKKIKMTSTIHISIDE